jgi:hypothetical protein
MGPSFTIAAGLRQRRYTQVRIPWDSRPYFPVSDPRLPQLWGPGSRIYIPQEQGIPVLPPGTGFPFHRLLRVPGLGWRYSNPPPQGIWIFLRVRYVTTDGQSASLSWNKAPIWGLGSDFYYSQAIACSLIWGALPGERTDLHLQCTM